MLPPVSSRGLARTEVSRAPASRRVVKRDVGKTMNSRFVWRFMAHESSSRAAVAPAVEAH